MTTPLVPSITDELIAEIEARGIYTQKEGGAVLMSGEHLLALISRLRAAERDAGRYRKLSKVTPYRFRKLQEAATTDGGDVFYFHRDRFEKELDAMQDHNQ